MQRCTDCGHSNRPGVRFCTHCGRPTTVSGAALGGPTTIVAAVVLAVGLLSFLTIQPVEPMSGVIDSSMVAASQADSVVAGSPIGEMREPPFSTPTQEDGAEPPGTAAAEPAPVVAALTSETGLVDVEAQRGAVASSRDNFGRGKEPGTAPVASPASSSLDSPESPSVDRSASASVDAGEPEPVDADAPEPVVGTASEPVDGAASEPVDGPAQPLHTADSALDGALSPELMTPAASPAAPLALQTAPVLSDPTPAASEAPDVRRSSARPRTHPAPVPAVPVSAGKRAAVDTEPSRGVRQAARVHRRASWLGKLRAELDACEGNLIVRTICEETAKMQYCTSAGAWGEVPECPAARLPDLATFN